MSMGLGAAGTVNETTISNIPGFPSDSFIPNATAGRKFVADRVAQGVDYIMVILDPLGPDNETLAAIVQASHAAGKLVITHAPSYADYSQAEAAGADLRLMLSEAPRRLPRQHIGSMTVGPSWLVFGQIWSLLAPTQRLKSGIFGRLRGCGSGALRLTCLLNEWMGGQIL
jgi:hypothetical protein